MKYILLTLYKSFIRIPTLGSRSRSDGWNRPTTPFCRSLGTVQNVEEFEGNNFLSVSYQTVELGPDGQATVDITLPDDPEQPIYFMAAVQNGDGSTGAPSNVVVLQNNPSQVDVGPGLVGDFENPPTDPDGDGRCEDVNGDGEVNVGDAQALFANGEEA